ncbi:MAG: hypothetical protein KDJ15_06885 [Alphaproteobacteria bacterium]|nr:hypothetical protein [Alphaproteobacteria bacterium]
MALRFFVLAFFIFAGLSFESARLACAADSVVQAPTFFAMLPDVPLMTGLTELPGAALTFDKPEGRIVESAAEGSAEALSPIAVRLFYDRTLPQLGWLPVDENGTFRRESDMLRYRIERHPERIIVHFTVHP